ncbi:MAG TPA: histidine phosphatase family protein [Candidatus Angelobacter sp.]|nr:histidine phosphatase family protein [Candidatus Angelobacter sp.]
MNGLRLVLVRHGVTDWNREGRFQGHRDPDLAEAGRHEAALAAERIVADDRLRPTRVVSSSLGRALATARPIAEASGLAVEADDRLMEIGQGEWEGRTHAELEVEDAERYLAWRRATGIRQPPGGEPIDAATARVVSFLADLGSSPGESVCVVSHGGTLRILAHVLLDLADVHVLEVDNASIGVAVRATAGWQLERWNDTLHLLGREPSHVDELEGRPLAL